MQNSEESEHDPDEPLSNVRQDVPPRRRDVSMATGTITSERDRAVALVGWDNAPQMNGQEKRTSEAFTRSNIERILLQGDFQPRATATLCKLQLGPSGIAIEFPGKALSWIDSGMHASYLNALRILVFLGATVRIDKSTLSLDHALQMAWRKRKG